MKIRTIPNFFTKKGSAPKRRGPKVKDKRMSKIISFRLGDLEFEGLTKIANEHGIGTNETARRIVIENL